VRPVFWGALADTAALAVDDQYLLGDHLLVAPVVDSAADARAVYLPAGRWYRVGSDSAYDGGRRVTVSAPGVARDGGDTTGLRGLPLFARAGAVVPMQAPAPHADARRADTLALHAFAPAAGAAAVVSELYEDAGDGYAHERGEYRRTTITAAAGADGGLALALARTGRYAGARAFAVTLHGVDRPGAVTADGRAVPVRYDAARRQAAFVVPATVGRVAVAR
jgi:alpha-glucosidase (family GH31 glycosyl hydrolase)